MSQAPGGPLIPMGISSETRSTVTNPSTSAHFVGSDGVDEDTHNMHTYEEMNFTVDIRLLIIMIVMVILLCMTRR